MEKYIAYQTVDIENDIWCNKALLFKTQEEASIFFSDKMNVFNALWFEFAEWEKEEDIIYDNSSNYHKRLICKYAWETNIMEMSFWIVINS